MNPYVSCRTVATDSMDPFASSPCSILDLVESIQEILGKLRSGAAAKQRVTFVSALVPARGTCSTERSPRCRRFRCLPLHYRLFLPLPTTSTTPIRVLN